MIDSKITQVISLCLICAALVLSAYLGITHYKPDESEIIRYSDNHVVELSDDGYTEPENAVTVEMGDSGIKCDSSSVALRGNDIYILNGGEYILKGSWNKGSVIVSTGDSKNVKLYLDNADIESPNFAAVCAYKVPKLTVSTMKGTVNRLSDSSEYRKNTLSTDTIDSVVYSAADITVNGEGRLVVSGSRKDGIKTPGNLKLMSCSIAVDAKDDGLTGNKAVYIEGGDISIKTDEGDGIKCGRFSDTADDTVANPEPTDGTDVNIKKSSSKTEQTHCFIAVEGGEINIDSAGDGFAAAGGLYLNGNAEYNIKTGGGYEAATAKTPADMPRPDDMGQFGGGNADAVPTNGAPPPVAENEQEDELPSAKAFKAGAVLEIKSGSYDINSRDDAVHSDGNIVISDGNFKISTGDDGVHANEELKVNGGSINIAHCYEGLEATEYVEINGGKADIIASDDGINSGAGMMMAPPGGGDGGMPPGPPPGMGGQNGGMPPGPPPGMDGQNGGMPPGPPPGMDGQNGGMPPGPPPGMDGQNGGMPPGPPPGMMSGELDTNIRINGGEIWLMYGGDGVDSNGNIEINGGNIIATGPGSGPDSAIDFDGTFLMNGGVLLTAGGSGMNELPSENSAQNCIWLNAQGEAGSNVSVRSGDEELYEFAAEYDFSLLLLSGDKLVTGGEYDVYIDDENAEHIVIDGTVTQSGNAVSGGMAPPMPAGADEQNTAQQMPQGMNGQNTGGPPGGFTNAGNYGTSAILTWLLGLLGLFRKPAVISIAGMLAALLCVTLYKRRY